MRKLRYLLCELESNQLQVCLAPSKRALNETDQIRVACSRNAIWYQKFCGAHLSKRGTRRGKPDTLIKRANTLRCLERMLAGSRRGVYQRRIMEILPGIKLT